MTMGIQFARFVKKDWAPKQIGSRIFELNVAILFWFWKGIVLLCKSIQKNKFSIQSRKFQAKDSKSSISDEVQSGSKKRNRVEDLKRIQENQRKRLTGGVLSCV